MNHHSYMCTTLIVCHNIDFRYWNSSHAFRTRRRLRPAATWSDSSSRSRRQNEWDVEHEWILFRSTDKSIHWICLHMMFIQFVNSAGLWILVWDALHTIPWSQCIACYLLSNRARVYLCVCATNGSLCSSTFRLMSTAPSQQTTSHIGSDRECAH